MADKIVHTVNVLETKNYDKFKWLKGNRPISTSHVNYLKKKIEENGNLTPQFPLDVNENMEIIDGQHRLEALKILKEPVYYQIKPSLDINSVISLNTGQKNWSWKDFAQSYADRGDRNYQEFIKLSEETGEKRFGTLMMYSTFGEWAGRRGSAKDTFANGTFEMKNYELALKHLGQYQEMVQVGHVNVREFAYACQRFMQRPGYDHERMIDKISAFGGGLRNCYTVGDFYRELDLIYKG